MSIAVRLNLSVSQNNLKDPRLVVTLVERSSLGGEDVVIEIGPGKGILTAELARRCQRVIAVEKDPALAAMLQEKFACQANLVIRNDDFLAYPLPLEPYKVFANIPFHITSAIVARLTSAPNPPEDAYLVMQKEAALTYMGKPRESLRSILLQPWFGLELGHQFQRSDFTPRPQVDAVLLRMIKRKPPLVGRADRQRFRDFVVYGYTTWRSTLGDLLKGIFTHRQLKQISQTLCIDLDATPTALRCEQWLGLFETLKHFASPQAAWLIAGSEARLHRQQAKLRKIHRTRKR